MQITFYGAAQTVTGSCYLLETGDKKIMVDCGMFQGHRLSRERNYLPFAVIPASVDYLLLTHAHIDHSGLVPKFYKNGFKGRALATDATVDLLEVLLPDSGHIQEMEIERLNRKARRAGKKLLDPIYTAEDAFGCVREIERVKYKQVISLDNNISIRFNDAGHILGSAILEIWVREGTKQTKLVFSGDLGAKDKPFVNDPALIDEADYLVMECTYGDRLHQDKGHRLEKLRQVIKETYDRGGNVIIPAFAVERTQDLLYDIGQLVIKNEIPPVQVFIDSPMAVAATEVFMKHPNYFDQDTGKLIASGINPLAMPNLHFSRTADESRQINEIKSGAIVLSASGMCDAGRIKHHLKHNLWRPECTVLFVGYQAPGTKGQRLLSGVGSIRIHGEEIAVKAGIKSIDGYSSHADQEGLLEWLGSFNKLPGRVFLVHGDPEALAAMEKLIPEKTRVDAYAPAWQETIQLTPGAEFSAEDLQQAYHAVAAKMDAFLKSAPEQADFNLVMKRLKDLEILLAEVKAG
ncbi:MBL fold metallo-hydrolase RNA specificity domain-containing protein [Desulfotruncus alcoholivorax]|uniref:MBL fold metallo-hydrolase RNA specificity domain-containing protein n=1 Tax=Desulfotruncus alcoholivorax TaxID=265477 RepID=UPI0003F88E2E|nr:MBL fold metallo-hydrolase [Desulfotruncus alcoholivorax]